MFLGTKKPLVRHMFCLMLFKHMTQENVFLFVCFSLVGSRAYIEYTLWLVGMLEWGGGWVFVRKVCCLHLPLGMLGAQDAT